MSIGSLLNAIFRHRPTSADIDKAKALAEAVEAFIKALTDILPEADGKAQALEAANTAALHANMALARGTVSNIASSPPANADGTMATGHTDT